MPPGRGLNPSTPSETINPNWGRTGGLPVTQPGMIRPWEPRLPMHGVCTTCTVTSGSGLLMGHTIPMRGHPWMEQLGRQTRQLREKSSGVAAGRTLPGNSPAVIENRQRPIFVTMRWDYAACCRVIKAITGKLARRGFPGYSAFAKIGPDLHAATLSLQSTCR